MTNYLILLLTLYPFLWISGLGGVFWLLAAPASIVLLAKRKLSHVEIILVSVGVAIIVCIPIGLFSFGWQPGRVLAAVANSLVWFGTAAYYLMARSNSRTYYSIGRAILLISTAQGFLTAVSLVLLPTKLPLPFLDGRSSSLPTGIEAFASNKLMYYDWLGETALRSAGMMGNPTWAGAFAACTLIFAVSCILRKGYGLLPWLATAASLISINYSLSRSVTLGLTISVVLTALLALTVRLRWASTPVVIVTIFGGLLIAASEWSRIVSAFSEVNSERAGSAESRGEIYTLTLDYVHTLGFPIVGYGIKPQIDGLVASLATHSTYLGFLFRTGIIPALFFIILLSALALKTAKRKEYLISLIIIFISIWCILEDFDGGHLLPIFLALAASKKIHKNEKFLIEN